MCLCVCVCAIAVGKHQAAADMNIAWFAILSDKAVMNVCLGCRRRRCKTGHAEKSRTCLKHDSGRGYSKKWDTSKIPTSPPGGIQSVGVGRCEVMSAWACLWLGVGG